MTNGWSKTGALSAVLALTLTGAAWARDLAVVVSNTQYRALPDIRADLGLSDLERAADRAGIRLDVLTNRTAEELQDWFADARDQMEEADRLFVFVVGHVVSSPGENWLLGTDAARQSDPFSVGREGLPLSPVLALMAEKPGAAVLMVASARRSGEAGPGLGGRFEAQSAPQGVSIVAGRAETLADLLEADLFPGKTPLGRAVEDRDLVGVGFLPKRVFGGSAPAETGSDDRFEQDNAAYRAAERADTERAWRDYLRAYPDGLFADIARDRLRELTRSPEAIAQEEEAALRLSRDARREIQRDLSILDHDPRGIDGIFGPGTRGAIRAWQRAEGLTETGYLSGNQIARLNTAAALRQAELEEEARRRQEEEDRRDAAAWAETGRGETEAGIRRYLADYPDGLFSDVARARLAEIEEKRQETADRQDRQAWRAAKQADKISAYRAYLEAHPKGAFREEAQGRIAELRADNGSDEQTDAARRAEAQVLINPLTRTLVIRRLDQLGLEPGEVKDGDFDAKTRRAIRRYQRARDIPVTGYIDQRTLVRMLAGN